MFRDVPECSGMFHVPGFIDARQMYEKLQCLYENLMSNNFRKTAVLKKISIVN